jgi:hypothetical protein
MQQTPSKPSNVIHLTTKQGLLLCAVLVLGFGAIFIWTATRFPKSFSGTVKTTNETLVPFGCNTLRAANTLIVPLRPDPQPEGFNEENRALIVKDGSTEGTTTQGRDVDVTQISWRNEQQEITAMNCSLIDDKMTVFSKRRGGQLRTREDIWSGTLKATCQAPIGEIQVDLTLENCDW